MTGRSAPSPHPSAQWVYLFKWIPAVTHTALLFAFRHTVKHHCRVQIDFYFQHWVCRPVGTGWPQSWLLLMRCVLIVQNDDISGQVNVHEFRIITFQYNMKNSVGTFHVPRWEQVFCKLEEEKQMCSVCHLRDVEKYLFVFYCPLDWEQCVILAVR